MVNGREMEQSTEANPFTPPRRRSPASGDEFKPKQVEEWLQELPLASAEKAIVLFQGRLDGLNQTEIPLADRFRILEACGRTLQTLLQEQAAGHAGRPFALSARDRRLTDLAQKLRVQLVVGYKIVLQQLAKSPFANTIVHRKTRTLASYHALGSLGAMLVNNYQLYQEQTPHTWKEIHGFYDYTERVRLEARAVADRSDQGFSVATACEQYKRLLLLALADPYALKPGQVGLIYRWLKSRAGSCRLMRHRGGAPLAEHVFAVDRRRDEPPGYLNRIGSDAFDGWILDIAPFAERVGRELPQPGEGGAPPRRDPDYAPEQDALDPELLRRLMLVWGVPPQRSRERTEGSGQLSAIVGVAEAHRLLGGLGAGASIKSLFPTGSAGAGYEVIPALEASQDELRAWGPRSLVESIDLDATESHKPGWTGSHHEDPRSQIISFSVIDASPNGYRLSLSGRGAVAPAVGALLALATDQSSEPRKCWRPAVVRWVCVQRSGDVEFGVQNIAGELRPLTVARIRGRGAQVEFLPCLLLQNPKGPGPSLITPAFYPHSNDRFFILVRGRHVPIVLTARTESTAAFARFLFVPRRAKDPA